MTQSSPRFIRLGIASTPSWLTEEGLALANSLESGAFDRAEYENRVKALRNKLEDGDLDAILVYRPSSVEYLCGHHTIDPTPQPLLVTHSLIRLYLPDAEIGRGLASGFVDSIGHYWSNEDAIAVVSRDVVASLAPGARIAVEDQDARVPPRVVDLLAQASLQVVPGQFLVEKLRLKLSAAELACVERAAAITERGAQAAIESAGERGATDSSVAAAVGAALRLNADSSAASDVIVATGRRGGIPHSTFSNTPLAEGTTFVEFSGASRRYHAPRMVTIARRELDDTDRRLERLSRTMLESVVREARPGRSASEIAHTVLAELHDLTDRDIFHFTCGYAIGLAHPPGWSEIPFFLVPENRELVEIGMAFHVAASFRSFGVGAVGLSHTIVIESGGARVLTGADARVVAVGQTPPAVP